MPSLPLTTQRLTLRPYEAGDLPALHDLFGRADVSRYLMWEPMDLDQARELLDRRVLQTRIDADGDAILLAAVETETGRMIGELMLRVTSIESGQGEIGWSLHPDAQGRGLATEGAREVLRAGFEVLGLHRIVAGADPRNGASLRVMERLGMRREAEFIEQAFVKGEWIDEVIYAILAGEWEAASKA
jgi:RimJ/RimL family protein N-acetyltransferase